MKFLFKALTILLFAALPFSLIGQNPTVIAGFMKVTPGFENEYLEVEQTWKKLHQKAVNEGIYQSWQLWRKLHTGADDPYTYATLQWYENYEATFNVVLTPEWAADIFPLNEQAEIIEKTMATREIVSEEVYHLGISTENSQAAKYLVIMRNNIPPERSNEYFKMEKEIFKPLQEEMIRRDALAQWGIWSAWPYKEGQAQVVIAEGFKDAKQLSNPGQSFEDVLTTIHPELNWEDLRQEVIKNREQVSVEIWELVDYVYPEQATE